MSNPAEIIVAGHICLDVIPSFSDKSSSAQHSLINPGSLTRVGPAVCSTGGAVANVGLALHKLGNSVHLIGKLGDDMFGRQMIQILNAAGNNLANTLRVASGECTSYTIVINPPGTDRFFLHCPGANDSFGLSDVDPELLTGARIFHFGYPPLMRKIYQNDGQELAMIFALAGKKGLATSLDMASIDSDSEAGRVDWRKFLKHVLPATDIFLPSLDELLVMTRRQPVEKITRNLIRELADELLANGAAIIGIKLGNHGFYVRTSSDESRLQSCPVIKRNHMDAWVGKESLAPCFNVHVAGTTGSGDCTIAGFLAALLRGESPAQSAEAAVAVGACSVEQRDAVSGIMPWPQISERIRQGWERNPCMII